MVMWRGFVELVGGSGVIYEPTTRSKFRVKGSASPSSIPSFLEQSLKKARLPIPVSHHSGAHTGLFVTASERVAWRIVEAACGCLAFTSIALPYAKTPLLQREVSSVQLVLFSCLLGMRVADSARCARHAKDAIHRFGRQRRGKRLFPMSGTKVWRGSILVSCHVRWGIDRMRLRIIVEDHLLLIDVV